MFEYMNIACESCSKQTAVVRAHLTRGWRPLGGVQIGYKEEWEQEPVLKEGPRSWALPKSTRKMYWVQTMTREGETK